MKSDIPYLEHILDSIDAIETYVAAGRDAFMGQRMIQDAVVRNFEIIGEAAGRLAPSIRAAEPDTWSRIIALRNRLIHGYWSVDNALAWDVIVQDLPRLRSTVIALLARGESA